MDGKHTTKRCSQLERIAVWQRDVAARLATLTAREHEVLRLLAAGKSNRRVAEALVLSQRTAEKHVSAILSKLQLRSARELLAFVLEHRLHVWLFEA